jgi:hypothetical protein
MAAPAEIRTNNKALGSPDQVLAAGRTLRRLDELYYTLPPDRERREKILQDIKTAWVEARDQLASEVPFSEIKKRVFSRPNMKLIRYIYEELLVTETKEEMGRCIDRFIKDADSLQVAPVQQSNVGDNGPTLLVRYLRRKGGTTDTKKYVFKRVMPNEVECNLLYRALISTIFQNSIFIIPETHAIDLRRRIHIRSTGAVEPLDASISEKLADVFKPYGGTVQCSKQVLMFMKYVAGENFRDFVRSEKYAKLSVDQKRDLFKLIGGITIVDVLLGNTDRFAQVSADGEESKYGFDELGANLGNVMVRWDPSQFQFPLIYVIDNLIEPQLLSVEKLIELYNKFLAQQLISPTFVQRLAENVMENIKFSTDPIGDQALRTIAADLEDRELNLQRSVEKGIRKTMRYIQERLLPVWKEGFVQGISPEIFRVVDQRIKIFAERRIQ